MVLVALTSRRRRDRREWATEHVNWRRNEWSDVLFSDESCFSVHPDNRRIFIWRDRGNLYIIRDVPLTARRYRVEILRLIVVPYAAAIGDDFVLMDDNCRPHRTNLDALGRRVAGRQPPPQTVLELERALLEEWDRIPQLVINSLIDSMPQSDEAHFWLNGNVNKQNCRIWSEANPQMYVETPLHPEKLTVWCALWAGGILLQKR
ncbi:transposable element Tcb2 transposase [Trichonephila clavipes]|nr:transposable element Tcb2 transposase [Trichonephila clavipes]